MIVCPNCNHQNPDGAVQCEACYTPLPATTHCPNCGAVVQADASFCGQCGFDLKGVALMSQPPAISPDIPLPEPLVAPDPLVMPPPPMPPEGPRGDVPIAAPNPPEVVPAVASPALPSGSSTQLQQQAAKLLHLQTNRVVDLPQGLTVIHIGKPNDRIPPDIDVSGYPDSEIVSRIHADIRVEGDAYYLEDVGSSNGTYVNNAPLPVGSRYRLRPGDRIALGKGDKMSFLFQL
jgi:pSer/pThr/pTyr-binding forkhead associated (FHA) protein/ribosomal protein L40E